MTRWLRKADGERAQGRGVRNEVEKRRAKGEEEAGCGWVDEWRCANVSLGERGCLLWRSQRPDPVIQVLARLADGDVASPDSDHCPSCDPTCHPLMWDG